MCFLKNNFFSFCSFSFFALKLYFVKILNLILLKELQLEFSNFQNQFNITYSDNQNKRKALEIFSLNLKVIEKVNSAFALGESSFLLAVNQFTDLVSLILKLKKF